MPKYLNIIRTCRCLKSPQLKLLSTREYSINSQIQDGNIPIIDVFPSIDGTGPMRSCLIKEADGFLGRKVILCGWLTNLRSLNPNCNFAVLRDYTGPVQLYINPKILLSLDSMALFPPPLESVIQIEGIVVERPVSMKRPEETNGTVEVRVDAVTVLNKAHKVSFHPQQTHCLPDEDVRLRERYLDLRRPTMQHNLRLRSQIYKTIRQFMDKESFVEIETPVLFKSTPEGAREFLVDATSIAPNSQFALPQSPQQFKQMLMVAGFDRYYQIAKCFRDEPLRADRQPEFTQLDVEMSFITQTDITQLVESLVGEIWRKANLTIDITNFPRLTYHEALCRFGTDKPDLRYSKILPISQCDHHERDGFITEHMLIDQEIKDILPPESLASIIKRYSLSGTSEIVYKRNQYDHVGTTCLGKIRNAIIQELEENKVAHHFHEAQWSFLWIYDFPLLARVDPEDGANDRFSAGRQFQSMHHPFTAPHPQDLQWLQSHPLKVRGLHYDLVLNGHEIGGGSIRIHDAKLQLMILRDVMGLAESSIERFEHLMRALKAGCPPHGGIALGLDRIMALICGTSHIRDVIAFPKNSQGFDLCFNSPTPTGILKRDLS